MADDSATEDEHLRSQILSMLSALTLPTGRSRTNIAKEDGSAGARAMSFGLKTARGEKIVKGRESGQFC
eukprot:2948661-Amphidinium_carterae.1